MRKSSLQHIKDNKILIFISKFTTSLSFNKIIKIPHKTQPNINQHQKIFQRERTVPVISGGGNQQRLMETQGRVGKPDRRATETECGERVMAESEGKRVYRESE